MNEEKERGIAKDNSETSKIKNKVEFEPPYKIHEYMKPIASLAKMTPKEFDKYITMCLYGRGRTNCYSYYLLGEKLKEDKI